ncbi:MAG: hypothetical protein IPL86_06950 [Flavobacteriales bacterium]|nr:hypothetical protein [Flavobacteriales bacterium]
MTIDRSFGQLGCGSDVGERSGFVALHVEELGGFIQDVLSGVFRVSHGTKILNGIYFGISFFR